MPFFPPEHTASFIKPDTAYIRLQIIRRNINFIHKVKEISQGIKVGQSPIEKNVGVQKCSIERDAFYDSENN